MVHWFKLIRFALTCLIIQVGWGSAAQAFSCAYMKVVYDQQDQVLRKQDDVIPADGNIIDYGNRFRPITPEESAQYYHSTVLSRYQKNLSDGEILFMGRFSFIRPQDKARYDDIIKLAQVMDEWVGVDYYKENGKSPLTGNPTFDFHDVLKFDGYIRSGFKWVPFSTQNITYQVILRDSAYAPFWVHDGRPPIDHYEFGVFTVRAMSKGEFEIPNSTFVVTNGPSYHQACPPAFRLRFKDPEDNRAWEDAFKTCALAQRLDRPEACWRTPEIKPMP